MQGGNPAISVGEVGPIKFNKESPTKYAQAFPTCLILLKFAAQ